MENILHGKGKKRFKKVKRKKKPTIHLHLVANIKPAQQKELKPAPLLRIHASLTQSSANVCSHL
jgi:hypothetical protein